MSDAPVIRGSLRRRLLIQLLALFLALSAVLYVSARLIAERAADASQDSILSASAASIAQQARLVGDEIVIDIPYAAFEMLSVTGEDRVFYRIGLEDGAFLTGYEDLPDTELSLRDRASFATAVYRGDEVRIATWKRLLFSETGARSVIVSVAQTREARTEIVSDAASSAAALGVGFLIAAGGLSVLAVQRALSPLHSIEAALDRRGANELAPLRSPAPREVAPLVQALNEFLRRLRTAFDTAESFIAEAAHRVRTPLAGVRAQAEFVLLNTDRPEDRKRLRQMIRAVDDVARATGQILDHAMVVYRIDRLETQPTDLNNLARSVCDDARPSAEMRDIDIDFNSDGAPILVACDEILVNEALRNLVDNALKYSPAESRVRVGVRIEGDDAIVAVTDEGDGFPTTDTAELAERFKRGENKGKVIGSGLGLTIVDQVARSHGGALNMYNIEDAGACAEFRLPLLEAAK